MKEAIRYMSQEKRDYLQEGARRYQEIRDALLSTPEAQAQFEEIVAEHDLWEQLVEARLEAGLTQKDLAKLLGVSQAQVARLEKCGYDAYTLSTLRRHAQALGKRVRISLV
jgi:DNA-binding XRE family transcriptional regulator